MSDKPIVLMGVICGVLCGLLLLAMVSMRKSADQVETQRKTIETQRQTIAEKDRVIEWWEAHRAVR